ncbi:MULTISPECIES: alpha/beta fold hydrolase [unclassified Streptomyces]|uniref:alpha/beta fold hydrolase n=1 Tax=unclassified Streptomyces TaxID=2593676 RepID=UPI0006AFD054|nr:MULTISPECIES: alpha/beta hydrolase [unclassified Streptomyces]KOX21085.1 hydrolase [Streptomyces sp. NRRL F-6491]KOX41083.1 hydrolase [Streptomyces sp. NRRL F-6492]
MARRLDVTGADGVRLTAWDYTPGPTGDGTADRDAPGRSVTAQAPGGGGSTALPGIVPQPGPARGPVPRPAGRPGPEDARRAPAPAPGVLLLHGLMGHAGHWARAAGRLTGGHRLVALDQRGHGGSGKPAAGPFTREAYVADAAAVVEQLGLGPVTLIGHSMGALTAWQLAAERPDLVRALVICDMRASALGAASQRAWQDWFRGWPAPFPSLEAVHRWFGDEDPWVETPNPARGAFFAEVMTERADGWRPVFDPEQMLTSRETWVHDAHWDSLAQVRCPTLVVRGLDGELGRAEAQEMVRVLPHGEYAEIPDAGHLLHYEHPDAWREAVEPFLNGVLTP